MDLSIIIVNWNTREVTCNCLKSIYYWDKTLNFEVILVDNNSSDDSVVAIRDNFPKVVLIESDENRGFAWANNEGMRHAKGDYFLLLNSDTLILGDVIGKTYSFINKHPEAGVVGCRVLNHDMSLQPTCFKYPSVSNILISAFYLNKLFPKNRLWGGEFLTWWNREEERQVQTVTGCFMLVKREHIEIVGAMDDSFFMYAEETDWCYRFEKAGFKNLFTPVGEIIHLGGASTNKVRPKMLLHLRAGILQFMRKNYSFPHYVLACCATSFWFLIRIPYWFMKSILERKKELWLVTKAYLDGFFFSLFGYQTLRKVVRMKK